MKKNQVKALKQLWKKWWNNTLSFLFPPLCLSCKKHVHNWGDFCAPCWSELVYVTEPFCKQCGRVFEFKIEDDFVCPKCIQDQPPYDIVRAVFIYNDISKKIILKLKNHDSTYLAKYMGRYMSSNFHELLEKADIIAPIPLHWRRLLKRKFNQSALMIQHLEGFREKKIYDLMQRHKNTPIQGTLDEASRIKNVKSAFKLSPQYNVKGKIVLLIDDVFTTGATVGACAKVLKRKGAKEVWCLSFARADGKFKD